MTSDPENSVKKTWRMLRKFCTIIYICLNHCRYDIPIRWQGHKKHKKLLQSTIINTFSANLGNICSIKAINAVNSNNSFLLLYYVSFCVYEEVSAQLE
jgi:hypothetical protein